MFTMYIIYLWHSPNRWPWCDWWTDGE